MSDNMPQPPSPGAPHSENPTNYSVDSAKASSGLSTGIKVLIGVAIAFAAGFLLLIAAAIAVPIILSNSDTAKNGAVGAPAESKVGASGAQDCQEYLDGFLEAAETNTGRESLAGKLEATQARIADPYIRDQMTTMIANVQSNIASNDPGANILGYCITNEYLTDFQLQAWLTQLERLASRA